MMHSNIYIQLTKAFNRGKVRVVICSNQAALLHQLTIMSNSGDWIIREDEESVHHIMKVLSGFNARYRFGAPFDIRWLKGGWSSYFEFPSLSMKVRAGFISRPFRMSPMALKRLWKENKASELSFLNLKDLAELKKTNREQDYVVIGKIARLMKDPKEQLLYSMSARDIINLARKYPHLVIEAARQRPILEKFSQGREKMKELLDQEKQTFIRFSEDRLGIFLRLAQKWTALWPSFEKEISVKPIFEAHQQVIQQAEGVLPFSALGVNI